MTFFVDLPDALQLVDGEYLPLAQGELGIEFDMFGRASSTFDFDLDLIAPRERPSVG